MINKEIISKGSEGKKTELKTIESGKKKYYIWPKKISVEGKNLIDEWRNKVTPPKAASSILFKYKQQGVDVENIEEIFKIITPDEFAEAFNGVSRSDSYQLYEAYLRFGVSRHTLTLDGSEEIGFTNEDIEYLLSEGDSALVEEIIGIIEGYNHFFHLRKISEPK